MGTGSLVKQLSYLWCSDKDFGWGIPWEEESHLIN